MAASKVTPEAINFMAKHGRGLVCLAMTPERLDELEIPLEVSDNSSRPRHGDLRVDRREGRHQHRHLRGRSRAHDSGGDQSGDAAARSRAPGPRLSAARAVRRRARARRPHRSRRRPGAHRRPAARRCDLRNHERRRHDGARAGAHEVRAQARPADDHDRGPDPLPDADRGPGAARWRRAPLPTVHGAVHDSRLREPHRRRDATSRSCAATSATAQNVLVRVHSKCLTGDVFHSTRCDCGPQLDAAMQRIAQEGRGVLAVPAPGRAGHRPREQDPRVRAAGPGAGHGRRPTSGSASSPTSATTASARRFCATWASGRCGC